MEKVLNKNKDTQLLMVGYFEYEEELKRLSEESSARDNIKFTGRMSREDLGVAYGAADVFVFPSVKDTQGLVLAEAALAGLPIVMVDEPVTEIVRHQQNGLIVDNNVEAIAEALTSILQNEELTKNMSKKSIELAAEYSEAKQTAKLIALCQHLVENQSAEPQVKRRRVRKLLTSFGRSVLDE
jgi:glycosyltransferase involved in cell wall biosynthesis